MESIHATLFFIESVQDGECLGGTYAYSIDDLLEKVKIGAQELVRENINVPTKH